MNEVIGDHMELKTFSNHLFKKLFNCVKKNYRAIRFRRVKCILVGFGNNDHGRRLEMRQPMFQIYASVSDIDKFVNAIFTSDNGLQISPGQFVQTQGR